MKQCPYCKADIQENARFCLYCMNPLVEKTVIAPMGKKRHWIVWVIVAALLLGGLVTALLLLPPKTQPSPDVPASPSTTAPSAPTGETDPPGVTDPPGEIDPPGETEPPEETDPPVETDPPAEEDPPKEPDSPVEPDPPVNPDPPADPGSPWPDGPPEDAEPPADVTDGHDYVFLLRTEATCTEPAMDCYQCTQCPTKLWIKIAPKLGHSFADATCTAPKICTVCNATEGEPHGHVFYNATCTAPKTCHYCGVTEGSPLGHKYVNGECTRCSRSTWCTIFVYDYYGINHPDGGIFDMPIDEDVIISNMDRLVPEAQHFKIPTYADEHKIVGFTAKSFHYLAPYAKSLYLPETIQSIEPGTFGSSATLTDIYIAGEEIDLTIEAFLNESGSILNRGPLTIHCSATCHDSQNNLIKDLTSDKFTIIFEEWDGVL